MVRNLRATGATVLGAGSGNRTPNPRGGPWRSFRRLAGWRRLGLLEAPKTWHVLEFKTHGTKSFADLTAKGVVLSKPQHAAQMQIYMHLTGITRALYMAVCKNTDALHIERVEADLRMAERLLDKAGRVIFAQHPPRGSARTPRGSNAGSAITMLPAMRVARPL